MLWAGPTTVRIGMLLAPTLAGGGVLVVSPAGQVVVATLGTGITLAANGAGYTIQATLPSSVVGVKPARQNDGTYVLSQTPVAATLIVHRNGLRMSVGDDYTYDPVAKKISPVTGYPWDASDLVLADYQY